MSRYIDADAVHKEIDAIQISLESNDDKVWYKNKPYYKGLAMARRIMDEQPTADVVPKSEVERLQIEIEALKIANEKMYSANKAQEAVNERLRSNIDAIFAEFELHIRKAVEGWRKQLKFEIEKHRMDMIMARLDAFGYCIYVLENLKEKYTGAATDEKAET